MDSNKFREIGKNAHANQRDIKTTNNETGEVMYFKSKSQAAKYHNCSPALVYGICEKKNSIFKGIIQMEYYNGFDSIVYHIIPDKRIGKSKYASEEEKRDMLNARMRAYYAKKKLAKLPKDPVE